MISLFILHILNKIPFSSVFCIRIPPTMPQPKLKDQEKIFLAVYVTFGRIFLVARTTSGSKRSELHGKRAKMNSLTYTFQLIKLMKNTLLTEGGLKQFYILNASLDAP